MQFIPLPAVPDPDEDPLEAVVESIEEVIFFEFPHAKVTKTDLDHLWQKTAQRMGRSVEEVKDLAKQADQKGMFDSDRNPFLLETGE